MRGERFWFGGVALHTHAWICNWGESPTQCESCSLHGHLEPVSPGGEVGVAV